MDQQKQAEKPYIPDVLLYNNDVTDYYEFVDSIRSKNSTDEELLWYGVLEQALYDFIDFWEKRSNNIKDFNEIYKWFFKEDNEDIGSFNFICDLLNINQIMIYKQLSKFVKENP
jgi:hypothetical protein